MTFFGVFWGCFRGVLGVFYWCLPIKNFKRLVLARMESYSVETMSGSFLSKFCVENWGDYSLKSSRGLKTSHSIRVLLFFSSSISQPLSTPLGSACQNISASVASVARSVADFNTQELADTAWAFATASASAPAVLNPISVLDLKPL